MRIYLITLFLIIADFQIKYFCALALDINKIETRANQPDLNGTFDGHPEPMDPDFPGFEDLTIISELDGASRLEPNFLGPELRQSPRQGCNDNLPACPSWASTYCKYPQWGYWMAIACKKSCNLCDNMCEWNSNIVYAQDSSSNTMTIQQCKQVCNSDNSCQFWTWNKNTRKCGIRDYETDGSRFDAPGQWTGRKNRNVEYENKVFVSRQEFSYGFNSCKNICQNDNKCKAVLYTGSTISGNNCVLTYGSNLRQFNVPASAGLSSNKKAC